MKIKLTQDLPIDPNCGAVEGAVFEVLAIEDVGRGSMLYFIGVDGQRCGAYSREYEVVEED